MNFQKRPLSGRQVRAAARTGQQLSPEPALLPGSPTRWVPVGQCLLQFVCSNLAAFSLTWPDWEDVQLIIFGRLARAKPHKVHST